MQRKTRSKSGTVQKRRTAKTRSRVCTYLISDTQFLGASFDTSIPDTLKRGCVNFGTCACLFVTQFVENLAINSTNHVVRRYAMIHSSTSAVPLQQLNPKTEMTKSKNFQSSLVVYDRQLWLEPENSLKLVKAKYFHSSLSFTIDTAIIHLTFCVSLWSHDCK